MFTVNMPRSSCRRSAAQAQQCPCLHFVLQLEAWQHIKPLAWLDRVIRMPSWKVGAPLGPGVNPCVGSQQQGVQVSACALTKVPYRCWQPTGTIPDSVLVTSCHNARGVQRGLWHCLLQVWSTHVMQFEQCPSDGPGALRLAFHEEVADQFVLLGLIPLGLYTIRTDQGTPLAWARDAVRHTAGRVIAATTPVVVRLLEAVGWIKE